MTTKLAADIKQTRPFRSPEEELALTVFRLATEVEGETADLLKGHGISLPQYNVLRILRGAGDSGLACGDIGERLVTRAPDMTRLLDRLERQGLITRAREASDRRVVTARITVRGLEVLAELDEPVAALQRAQFGHLSQAKVRTLLDLLGEVRTRPNIHR